MKKRKLILVVLVLMIVCVNTVLAQNMVEVKVTSEPIQEDSFCGKAGGYTLEFHADTMICGGQQITIDLPLNVSLSRDIDFTIEVRGVLNAGYSPASSCYEVAGGTSSVGAFLTGSLDFEIKGEKGSQRITFDVVEAGINSSIQVGSEYPDRFVIKFLDYPDLPRMDVFVDGVWDFTGVANSQCIDISNDDFLDTTVNQNLDSKYDQFTFIPSNPQVAHIVSSNYECLSCELSNPGNIEIGAGSGGNCSFDYESGFGYFAGTYFGNHRVLASYSPYMLQGDYFLTLEIVGTPGVYWSSDTVQVDTYATVVDACNAGVPSTVFTGCSYYLADGSIGTPVDLSDCNMASSAKVVKIVTNTEIVVNPNYSVMWIDLPRLLLDEGDVALGDHVQVRVSVNKYPCGAIITCDVFLGVLGANNMPIADAGPDQIVPGSSVVLDGSASNDSDGIISSWEWVLSHTDNSGYDRIANGEVVSLFNMGFGHYDVTLTVTDNFGAQRSDGMFLSVADSNVVYTQLEYEQAQQDSYLSGYVTGYIDGQETCDQCALTEDAEGNKFLDGPLFIENNGLLTIQ